MKKILRASVSETPYDMVAGNPNSMMSMMSDSSFQRAGGGTLGSFVSYVSPNASRHHFKFQNEKRTADVYSLPLAKTFKFGQSGWALMFDMPLTYADIDGSVSYAAQLGLALKVPVVQKEGFKWNIIPGIRAGAVGSEDMLSGGLLYSGTIASDIQIPTGAFTFGITNMAGIIKDFSVKVADYEIEYDLKNYVFKNGAQVRWDFAQKWAISTSYNYTFYN